ncbi:MAG: Rieske (2Fe-2S) protein [Qingshengfaniella sp.]
MADYRDVLDQAQLPEGKVVAVTVEGHVIALALVQGFPRAFQSLCPHEKASLQGAHVEGCTIRCPRHLARFDLDNGQVSAGWRVDPLRLYPARLRGGWIQVDVDAVRRTPPEGPRQVWDLSRP